MNGCFLTGLIIPLERLIGKIDFYMEVIEKNIPENRHLRTLTNTVR